MPRPDPIDGKQDSLFVVLVRLFFSRFFDKESLSPQGDPAANVVQTLGLLAAPGSMISLLLYFNPQIKTGWNLVTVRCLFLCLSLAVTAFVVVFEWDALFFDRRDYQVLLPLPLPLWKLFLAKMTAFILFLGLFLVALNAAATLFWPIVFDNGPLLAVTGTHLLVILAAGLFAAFAAASVQGLLLTLVPSRIFRPISTAVQTLLMTALVTLFFLSPFAAGGIHQLIGERSALAAWVPGYWYSGLYEQLRPATGDPRLLHLGQIAIPALLLAMAVFALTHLPLYLRHTRKIVETPPPSPSGPGRLRVAWSAAVDRWLLKDPTQQAVYRFIGQTISRSMKHRLFLAVYAGFGAALVVIGLGAGATELLRIPLTLSFVLVTGLRAAFSFPAELGANWAFQVGGADRLRDSLIATRKWIAVRGVIPLFLLLAPLELAVSSWSVVLFQTACGIVLSALLTEIIFFDFRKIPFTCGYFPSRNNLAWLIAIYVGGLVLYGRVLADIEYWLMWNPQRIALFFAGIAGLLLIRWRWLGRAQTGFALDYLGDDDPLIRTLELTPH